MLLYSVDSLIQAMFSDLNAVKMILDIFTTEPEIVSTTFYDNDLRVLCDVLCRDLLDTDIPEVCSPSIGIRLSISYNYFRSKSFIL